MAKLACTASASLDGYAAGAVGGHGLAAQAIKAGLVDEYRLLIAPAVGGGGRARMPPCPPPPALTRAAGG